MKLARDLDARFESLLLTGRVSKWYSEVGNEATTVAAGLALGGGRRAVHPPPRPRRHPRRLPRPGAHLPRPRLRRARRSPPRAGRPPLPPLLPAPRQGRRLLARRRALLPLRLPRPAGGHPPRRHDQPPGVDDPGGRRLRLRARPPRRRAGGDQLHRRRRHLDGRLPRGAQHGGGVEAAAGAGGREQPLRLLDADPPAVCLRAALGDAAPATGSPPRRSTATTPTRWRRRWSAPWRGRGAARGRPWWRRCSAACAATARGTTR